MHVFSTVFFKFQAFSSSSEFHRGHPCHPPSCTPASSACMVPMLVLCCQAACLIWLHVNSHRYPILSVTRLSALYSRNPVPKCAGLHRCACVQRSSWFFPVSIPPSRATTCEPSFHNELRAAAMLDLPSVHIRQLRHPQPCVRRVQPPQPSALLGLQPLYISKFRQKS